MTETKITKRELFIALLQMEEVRANPLYVEKLEREIQILDEKNINRQPTQKQKENAILQDKIVTFLSEHANNEYKAGEIMKACGGEFTSNQHCNALLRQLIITGKVARVDTTQGARFTIARLVKEA